MVYILATLIAAVVAVVAFALILYLVSINYTSLDDAAALTAIFIAIMAPAAYLLKSIMSERDERRKESRMKARVIDGMCYELQDTLDGLNRDKYKNEALSFTIKGKKKVYFMNRHLNRDFYDSVLISGTFYLIEPKAYQKAQDVYTMVKYHNAYLDQSRSLARSESEEDLERAYILYEWLDKSERKMIKRIPELIRDLRGDLG